MIVETFRASGQQATAILNRPPQLIELTPADLANPSSAFASIPSGTADRPLTVLLPYGEYETDATINIEDKRHWHLLGGPTTFRFPTYGPIDRGLYDRRHLWLRRVSDFKMSRVKIWGPHNVRSSDPGRARYDADKAFQHGIAVAESSRVTLQDIETYEIAGDGLYLASGCWDIVVDNFRVEYNGRQGFAGIGGGRWYIHNLNVVNSGRFAIDLEPIGNWPDGTRRSVDGVTVENCYLKGGIILHRVSDITIIANLLWNSVTLSGSSLSGAQHRRGVRILDNVWPDPIASPAKDSAAVKVASVDGLEVRGNRAIRDPLNTHTRNAAFVEVVALPVLGHIVVQDNDIRNWATPFRFANNLDPALYADVTLDVQA